MTNPSLLRYRESQMTDTSPEKTVLMLYEGAERFLRSAIKEIENNNIPEKALLVEKTVKIIDYLQSCLDIEKGGEIAVNLNRLYNYIGIRLTQANLKNDIKKMQEVLKLLGTIRDGWKEICDTNSGGNGSKIQATAYSKTPSYEGMDKAGGPQITQKVGIKA